MEKILIRTHARSNAYTQLQTQPQTRTANTRLRATIYPTDTTLKREDKQIK